MASLIFNRFKYQQLGDTSVTPINLKTDTIKLMLLTSSYTPNADHDFLDDIRAYEVSASGSYSAGGVTLAITTSVDNATDKGVADATDVAITTATITARYAALYKSTGTDATSPLICLLDFGTDKSSSGGTYTITFSASGIINVT